ncbi:MAG: hypothetical protein SF187_25340 [Deltaproteobacteria bacterium]|nr:hypothetical protein [Deltaproteobacteria bacterium]
MSRPIQDPVRLRDVPPDFDASGVRAGDLFRAAGPQPRFHDAQVELLLRRTRAIHRRSALRRLIPALTSLPVLLLGMTVGAATTAIIGGHWFAHERAPHMAPLPQKPKPATPKQDLRPTVEPQEKAEPPSAPEVRPEVVVPQKRLAFAKRAATEIKMPPEPPAEPTDAVAPTVGDTTAWALPPSAEAQLLREAVRSLRVERRPAVALDMLKEFERVYADSDLAYEAKMLSAEALLALGQRSEALEALNAVAHKRSLPIELALLRAELLAAGHQCKEAMAALQQIRGAALRPLQQERVLYGEGVCLAELGDSAAARRVYLDYQTRFPHGRFAQSVRRALGGTNETENSP